MTSSNKTQPNDQMSTGKLKFGSAKQSSNDLYPSVATGSDPSLLGVAGHRWLGSPGIAQPRSPITTASVSGNFSNSSADSRQAGASAQSGTTAAKPAPALGPSAKMLLGLRSVWITPASCSRRKPPSKHLAIWKSSSGSKLRDGARARMAKVPG